jgi:hypothetical protein
MTNWDHHASASPDINDIAKGLLQHPADTLLHMPAQHADNGSPTVTDGVHPAHPHFDGNQPASFKFADDGSSHPGPVPHDPPPLAALSSDLSEDHSAHSFKPNSDPHASADREISDVARDNLPQHAADNGPPAVTEGAHPANPHSDGNEPANPKFADDGSAHPGKVPHDPPTALSGDLSGESAHPFKPNSDDHPSADPGTSDIAQDHLLQHAADNSPHGPAQHDDNGSSAVTDGAHPAHPHSDANQPANPQFADDGSDHPGPMPHDPPPPTALSNDLGEDHPASPVKPNSDDHASADPGTSDIAQDHLLQHAADNSPHGPAQPDNNGLLGGPDDSFKFADDDSAHPGPVAHDPSALAANDLSGNHEPAAPAAAQTVNAPGTVVSDAAAEHIGPDQFIFGQDFHNTIADLKPDMTELDPTTIAEIEQFQDIAHDANAVGTLDPHHAMAPQDAPLPQPPGEFHFA